MWCFRKKLLNWFPVNWCQKRNGEAWVCNRARAGFTIWSMIQVPVNSWVSIYSNCCCKGICFPLSIYVSKNFIENFKCHVHSYVFLYLLSNVFILKSVNFVQIISLFNISSHVCSLLQYLTCWWITYLFSLQVQTFMNDLENSNH